MVDSVFTLHKEKKKNNKTIFAPRNKWMPHGSEQSDARSMDRVERLFIRIKISGFLDHNNFTYNSLILSLKKIQ